MDKIKYNETKAWCKGLLCHPAKKWSGPILQLSGTCTGHFFILDTVLTLTFTFGADSQSRPALRPCMFGPMRNSNTTKGQENLLVALANW